MYDVRQLHSAVFSWCSKVHGCCVCAGFRQLLSHSPGGSAAGVRARRRPMQTAVADSSSTVQVSRLLSHISSY